MKVLRPIYLLPQVNSSFMVGAMEKEWRPVPGYEGTYEISEYGDVRRLDKLVPYINRWGTQTIKLWPGRVLTQSLKIHENGYVQVQVVLSQDGAAKKHLVPGMVASAFIGPRPFGHEVAHNDGNSQNNHYSNLRYATPRENNKDKIKHGTHRRGSEIYGSKLTEEEARVILSLKGKEKLRETASKYGIAESAVSRIQNGVRWGWLNENA